MWVITKGMLYQLILVCGRAICSSKRELKHTATPPSAALAATLKTLHILPALCRECGWAASESNPSWVEPSCSGARFQLQPYSSS